MFRQQFTRSGAVRINQADLDESLSHLNRYAFEPTGQLCFRLLTTYPAGNQLLDLPGEPFGQEIHAG